MNFKFQNHDYCCFFNPLRSLKEMVGIVFILSFICSNLLAQESSHNWASSGALNSSSRFEILLLGIAQDAGYPQINCYQAHCMPAWKDVTKRRMATSLALLDHQQQRFYLFEATPDIKQQLYQVYRQFGDYRLAGIFLTHAHMGHYTGLMHLGREAQGADSIPVYAMPRMLQFLKNNGPWSQLVTLKNIQLRALQDQQSVQLAGAVKVIPFLVPHRDEFSETVGFQIISAHKKLLFIPDIDKWQRWKTDVRQKIKQVDYALLDATFFAAGEIKNRDMSEIPHPFVAESMAFFSGLSLADKNKVIFIHFNHTNPLLIDGSDAQKAVQTAGYHFAREGMRIGL